MLKIGLTGGIASGKSAAAEVFAGLGVPVIDADVIARERVAPGSEALAEIVCAFGPEMLTPAGELDRPRLRRRVFADAEARARLEAILHPRIREALLARLETLDAPYVVLVIPLLVEAGWQDLVDRVLVIDAPEALQRERLMRRDGLSAAEAEAMLAAQADRATRCAAADDRVVNDGSLDDLRADIEKLHGHYLALAGAGRTGPSAR
ncbi:dephospho-CoA kinase [Thiohalobacter sp.]|uniref:dephospho-CoA kinase n=1 Tax=Thiohalobacter sp. TaxID=2025948 RepID=UPI002624F06F|nr:dephospho-CoA kinase [Thiohalobacter sp.]